VKEGLVASNFELSDEPSDSTTVEDFVDPLRNWQRLEKKTPFCVVVMCISNMGGNMERKIVDINNKYKVLKHTSDPIDCNV
jgi:hypothetical protein